MSTALARKFRIDVSTDLTLAGGWVQVNGIYNFKPTVKPTTIDTSAYDTNGWDSNEVISNGWSVTANYWRRNPSGVYDPGQELIRARVGQTGDAARIGIRWYDKNGGPEASQGVSIVEWDRATDGVKDADAASNTLTGDGVLTVITNPGVAAVAPLVLSALPTAIAVGGQVTITGTGFTGTVATTGVKFGATNATTWSVVSDSVIVAVMPAGSAGSANVTVTNAVGVSNSYAYTRGA
jgi:hypothetical protein